MVVERVRIGSRADVALLVEVAFDLALRGSDHQVVPQVEFAVLVQKGLLYVGLDDVGAQTAVGVSLLLFYGVFDLLQVSAVLDVLSSVAQLAGLHDPAV